MLIFTWGLEGLAAGKTNIGLPNFHLCHLCDICNKYFTQKTHIRTHKHSFHEGKNYRCDTCDKQFPKKQKSKNTQRQYSCSQKILM